MEMLMTINDLTLSDKEKMLLQNIDLTFYKGVNVFLTGTGGSGKTLLLKEIKKGNKNIIAYQSYEVLLEEKGCKNYHFEDEKIKSFFKIDELLKKNNLTKEEEILIKLGSVLDKKPKLLFMDQLLDCFKRKDKQRILNFIMKELKITLVYNSIDIEDAMYFDYMVILDKGLVAIEGKTLQVLEEEKLLKRLGIGLPFIIDLSIQLKLYGLVNKIYTDKRKLVADLWK